MSATDFSRMDIGNKPYTIDMRTGGPDHDHIEGLSEWDCMKLTAHRARNRQRLLWMMKPEQIAFQPKAVQA